MNAQTPTRYHPQSAAYSASLTLELAKMLALVAPTSMTTEQQELWLRAAVDALEDIRPDEVAAVSAEIKRSVSHPSKIVPEIAKLVAERRARPANPGGKMTALQWAEGARERGLPKHYEAWMAEARRRGEIA